jgi:hypothetical protein
VIAALAVSTLAQAAPQKIDAGPAAGKVDVYRDELGNFYILPRAKVFADKDAEDKWIFYGDRKTLYRQRPIDATNDAANHYWRIWSPRAKGLSYALIERVNDKLVLHCRDDSDKSGTRTLTPVAGDEARTLLAHATLLPPLWQREAHALARDDEGIYYYVDRLLGEAGGNGYRVFVGMTGAMKEQSLITLAVDSSGEIFATKAGTLKIIANKGGVFWIKNGKKIELTWVDVQEDRYLIYRGLGLYGQLGTVCEEM